MSGKIFRNRPDQSLSLTSGNRNPLSLPKQWWYTSPNTEIPSWQQHSTAPSCPSALAPDLQVTTHSPPLAEFSQIDCLHASLDSSSSLWGVTQSWQRGGDVKVQWEQVMSSHSFWILYTWFNQFPHYEVRLLFLLIKFSNWNLKRVIFLKDHDY